MDSDESVKDDNPIKEIWVAPVYESSESIDSLEDYIAPEPEDCPKMKLYKEGLYNPGSGEICAKYIAVSASSVLRHSYFDYPSIKDPGIEKALLLPEEYREYDDDGQELYLDLCEKMNIIPVRIFYRGLITEEIDLKYYGVNPVGMRAMCIALARNRTVKRLDLTSNYMDHLDACYHIGQLLGDRNALKELVLSGCNIGSKLLRHALNRLQHRILDLLDLSENNIKDEGFPFLTEQIILGAVIRRFSAPTAVAPALPAVLGKWDGGRVLTLLQPTPKNDLTSKALWLNLRRNHLTSDSLSLLAEVIEFHDHTTHLDISWNMFNKTAGAIQLIRVLRQSNVLVELNLSYTSLCVGVEIGALLRIETLKVLDVSHNRLTTSAAKPIAKNLILAKSLQFLDLSCNPFGPSDALLVLLSMKEKAIKLRELRMDSIEVNKEFAQEIKEIRNLQFRQNTVITHGYVLGNYTLSTPDLKIIYLKQLETLTKKKGDRFDMLVYLLDLYKTREVLEIPEFMQTMKRAGAPVNDEFVAGLSRCFPGPKTQAKIRPLNLGMLADYIHRIYPEKEPTPTPEPTMKLKRGGKRKK